jgi:hypothetical protein
MPDPPRPKPGARARRPAPRGHRAERESALTPVPEWQERVIAPFAVGRHREAAAELREIIRADPRLTDAAIALGAVCLPQRWFGKYEGGLRDAREGGNPAREILVDLVITHLRLGKPAEARRYLDDVLATHPRRRTLSGLRSRLSSGRGTLRLAGSVLAGTSISLPRRDGVSRLGRSTPKGSMASGRKETLPRLRRSAVVLVGGSEWGEGRPGVTDRLIGMLL